MSPTDAAPGHLPLGRRRSADSPLREDEVAVFLDRHGQSGLRGVMSILRHPVEAAVFVRAIRSLPVLTAPLQVTTPEHRAVRAGLLRNNRLARRLIGGTTAVLTLPREPGTFAVGSSASKRSLRTKLNRAARADLRWRPVDSMIERRRLLELTDRYELNHPLSAYRGTRPDSRHLLRLPTWLLASTPDGRPLLLAVPAIADEWAVLQHFKTLEDSDEARIARYWMSVVLVDVLVERGVHHLADMLSPLGLQPGLRLFQRRIGYRYARVRVRARSGAERSARQPSATREARDEAGSNPVGER